MAKVAPERADSIFTIVLTPGSDVSHTVRDAFAVTKWWILKTYCAW